MKHTKPKRSPLTNAQSRERAIEAHRLPEGTIGRQYQIVLTTLAMEWFLALSSRERGAIVESGRVAAGKTNVDTESMENDHARIRNIQK